MINIAIIGYGYWGPNLVRNFSELANAKVAAVADLDPTRPGLARAMVYEFRMYGRPWGFDISDIRTHIDVWHGSDDAEVTRRASAIGRSVRSVRAAGMAGTPDQIVDRIGDYAKAGADCLYLQVLDLADLDHVGLLGAEVLPQVS